MTEEIQLVVEDASWRAHRGLLPRLVEAAEAARKSARLPAANGLTILLADDARLMTLNRDFRGKNNTCPGLFPPAKSIIAATSRWPMA